MEAIIHQEERHYSTDERVAWVRRYRESGLGLKRFAAEHGLSAVQLHYWVYARRAGASTKSQTAAPLFQEIKVAECLGSGAWSAEIGLREGTVVRFRAGTDPVWMASLLGALRP